MATRVANRKPSYSNQARTTNQAHTFYSYWDWSRDAKDYNSTDMGIFQTEIFSELGMGGNGPYIANTPDPFGTARFGRTCGGCVDTDPFQRPNISINVNGTEPGACLKRDMIPFLINWWGQRSLVEEVLSQPDFTSFARALEGNPTFEAPNIHGSGHFGTGGTTSQIGNAYNSPAGALCSSPFLSRAFKLTESSLDPLFYLHHGNLDHITWLWQQQDPATRLYQVGGNVIPFAWGSSPNVTLDFEVDMGVGA